MCDVWCMCAVYLWCVCCVAVCVRVAQPHPVPHPGWYVANHRPANVQWPSSAQLCVQGAPGPWLCYLVTSRKIEGKPPSWRKEHGYLQKAQDWGRCLPGFEPTSSHGVSSGRNSLRQRLQGDLGRGFLLGPRTEGSILELTSAAFSRHWCCQVLIEPAARQDERFSAV